MAKRITVTIDGSPVTISELRPRENAAWRKRVQQELGGVVDLLSGLPSMQLDKGEDLIALFRSAMPLLLPAVSTVWELCAAYSPAFEEAYESEAFDAFPEVLSLAFPLGGLVTKAAGLLSGLDEKATSPNSAARNGASGTTKKPELTLT